MYAPAVFLSQVLFSQENGMKLEKTVKFSITTQRKSEKNGSTSTDY